MEGKSVFVSDVSEHEEFLKEKCPIENRLLKIHVRLDNGSQGQVFSVLPTEQGPRWHCHVCSVTLIGSFDVYKHEKSIEHAAKMNNLEYPSFKFRPLSPPPKPKQMLLEMKLAPGEPLPPGFEGEVHGIIEIQSKLDNYSSPLIGLEYLVELLPTDDDREPGYICILCDKRGDPRTVMNHLVSYYHRLKFFQTHFAKAYKKFQEYAYCKDQRKQCSALLRELSEWIEKRFGRLSPHASEKSSFEKNRKNYTKKIVDDVHFSEKCGETLEELIDEVRFTKQEGTNSTSHTTVNIGSTSFMLSRYEFKKIRSPSPPVVHPPGIKKQNLLKEPLSPISSVSSTSLSDTPSRSRSRSRDRQRSNKYWDSEDLRRTRSRSRSNSRSRSKHYRKNSRSRSSRAHYHRSNYPGVNSKYSYYSRSRSDFVIDNRQKNSKEVARWEEYRKGCAKIEIELEHSLSNHEKNPERHPQYPEEWKKFWNRRYKELQAEHKDPMKHDFKPEWIDYWNKRIKELHDIELKTQKENLRKRLNLPNEPQPVKFKINSKKSGKKETHDQDRDIIIIDDEDDDAKSKSFEKRERTRSRSPWESDLPRESKKYVSLKRDYYTTSRSYPERSVHSILNFYPQSKEEDESLTKELNIVAVLRLLTALEDKLGSLGPKVIDMLSTALAMEKAEANSAETLLDNDVHCVLFETVKEKLKGQLLAGMIDLYAEKPTKNAIKQIASLLHQASERKRKEFENREKVGSHKEQVIVPGIGEVDKAAIARQIATALVAQGRTDVTQEELEQLISAVVGMAQASQGTGVTITAAEYAAKVQTSRSIVHTKSSNNSLSPILESNAANALKILNSTYSEQTKNTMEGLSDSDLKTLLQNFKDLSSDEQHALISYLKKLEATEPERVSRLRIYVNSGSIQSKFENEMIGSVSNLSTGRESPFSGRQEGLNPTEEKSFIGETFNDKSSKPDTLKIDSDEDDDYTYEDVFKAASKNLKEKQLAEERKLLEDTEKNKSDDPNILLNDAKQMIANIMGQLGQKNSSPSINLLGLHSLDHGSRTISNISAEVDHPGSSIVKMNTNNSISFEDESSLSNNLMSILSNTSSLGRQNISVDYNKPTGYNRETDLYSSLQSQKPLFEQSTYQDNFTEQSTVNNYDNYSNGSYNNGHFRTNLSYQSQYDNFGIDPMTGNQNYTNYHQAGYGDQIQSMPHYPSANTPNVNLGNHQNRGYNNQNYY